MADFVAKATQAPGLLIANRRPFGRVVVNLQHRYAKNLILAYLGGSHEIVHNQPVVYSVDGNIPRRSEGRIEFNSVSNNPYVQFSRIKNDLRECTIISRAKWTANASRSSVLGNFDSSSDKILFRRDSSKYQFYVDNGSLIGAAELTDSTLNKWVDAVGRMQVSGSNTVVHVQVNGVNGSTDSGSVGNVNLGNADSPLRIGRSSSSQNSPNAIIDAVLMFDCFIPDEQLIHIRRNLFQFFVPANDLVFLSEISGAQTIPVGISSETDTALAVTLIKPIAVDLGQSQETDTALGVTVSVGGDQTIPVAISTETDTALSVIVQKDYTIQIGIAAETDTSLPLFFEPPEPYEIGWTGGGRVMRKGEFPEWWKEEEEPQPQEEKKERKSTAERIAEVAETLPIPKPQKSKKVVPIRKKKQQKSEPKQQPVEPKKEVAPPPIAPEIQALQSDMKEMVSKMSRMEKRLAAALLLLLRNMRR